MTQTMDSSGIERLKIGGVDELTKLFMEHRASLRAMVASRINGRLSARFDASDIVQDSFIRAKKQLKNYLNSPQIRPVVWLRLLCKQLLTESIRKNMRGKRSPEFETHSAGDQLIVERIADSLHSVGEAIAKKELTVIVQTVMSTMNETDREIIEMRHTEGMTFPDIARLLEMKMETAKKRYYRAIARFRDFCQNDE